MNIGDRIGVRRISAHYIGTVCGLFDDGTYNINLGHNQGFIWALPSDKIKPVFRWNKIRSNGHV